MKAKIDVALTTDQGTVRFELDVAKLDELDPGKKIGEHITALWEKLGSVEETKKAFEAAQKEIDLLRSQIAELRAKKPEPAPAPKPEKHKGSTRGRGGI